MYDVKIIRDSINEIGNRLTTFSITLPRIVLAEFNTHRMLSRNSASSRAIPVEKRISMVEGAPFIPEAFGRNQKGMQASENLSGEDEEMSKQEWLLACQDAIYRARQLNARQVHKQLANRVIEPYCWQTILLTATDFENYFALRTSSEAQPEIQKPSQMMLDAYNRHSPTYLKEGEWHLPLTDDLPQLLLTYTMKEVRKISIGRCARVSYLTHEGTRDPEADLNLYNRLLISGHMSPFEHVARPMTAKELELFKRPEYIWDENIEEWVQTGKFSCYLGNFNGWVQHRKLIVNESNYYLMKRSERPSP